MWEFFIYVYAKYASYQAYCFRPVFRIFLDVREPMNNNNEEDDDQFNSVAQSWLTFCAPMDCSTPGLPVHHQLPELAQTHVPWVNDDIQPSHPLSSHFLPTFNLSQHQDIFLWVSYLHQVAKLLELQLQHQSFQWIFRTDFLKDGLVGSPCSPRDSQESSPTPQFKSINSLALSLLYGPTVTPIYDHWKNHSFDVLIVSLLSLLPHTTV